MKESLLLKYLSGKTSEVENEEVVEWVDTSRANRKKFLEYKKIWAFATVDCADQEQVWRQVQIRIELLKKREKQHRWYYAAAACIIGLLVLTIVFLPDSGEVDMTAPDLQNEIVLELDDGTQKIIKSGSSDSVSHKGVVVGVQKGQQILYKEHTDANHFKKLAYNTIYVPFGKKFTVELSDGTVVNLNSGSRLKYPVQFLPDSMRQVFLEGEAYFNVTKNTERAFVVNADNLKTKVYGTQFNISSYSSNKTDHVVLVEGKIGVSFKKLEETIMEPRELMFVDKQNWTISKSKIDIQKYIAWKDGVLWFDSEPFVNITRTLERHYNVIIENKLDYLNTIKFTGTFENNESIEEILAVFADYKFFKFKKENNLITIY